jgi:putative transposase
MQLTQQIKIKPTYAQELVLLALSERCRLIYNFALSERKESFEKGESVGYVKQANDLPNLKEKYPEYKWVYSKVLQGVLKKLDADYKSFFSLRKKDATSMPPNFKRKNFFTTMNYNQSGFSHGKGYISFSHKHPLGTKLRFVIPEKFSFSKIYQIELYHKDKNYWLSVVYESKEEGFVDNGLIQSFDLGVMKHTAVNMEGKFHEIKTQRPDRYWQKSLENIQSRRDHCKKYSNRWKANHKLYCKLRRKSSNQMRDILHKSSRKVIDNTKANTILVGDLNPKKMCQSPSEKKNRGLHKSLHNIGIISTFVSFLTYKAKRIGKRVVENSEYKTSKRCCCCGKEKDMPLQNREYVCDCGNKIDRDRNSSINIMLDYLSQNGLWTTYKQFVDNLRKTGLTIVRYSQEAPSSTSSEVRVE